MIQSQQRACAFPCINTIIPRSPNEIGNGTEKVTDTHHGFNCTSWIWTTWFNCRASKAGKTSLLKEIAHSVTTNHPEAELIVLLIDERPEEVTDIERSVKGDVVSSTFDEVPENHIKVAELVLERAMRLVEHKKMLSF